MQSLLWSLGFLSLVMAAALLVVLKYGNGGWADTFWTFGTGSAAVATASAAIGSSSGSRAILVMVLAALWTVRLGSYLLARTLRHAEDARYADLRREWGEDHPRRLFRFLQAQALAALPLVAAIGLAASRPGPLDIWDAVGALLMIAGLAGTAVADAQLARFKADPANRGKICDTGLWSVSRHPNYFFEWLTWCAWPVMAFDFGWPPGMLALMAPTLMYYLLVHVSGVPPLEAHMERSRGAAFEAYRAKTPVFFPRLP